MIRITNATINAITGTATLIKEKAFVGFARSLHIIGDVMLSLPRYYPWGTLSAVPAPQERLNGLIV
jgi:hypothetical protein